MTVLTIKQPLNGLKTAIKTLILAAIRGYQWVISPLFPSSCRYVPTCSHYAVEAFGVHGTRKGLVLTLKRLINCRPGGRYGYDPVPEIQQIKK